MEAVIDGVVTSRNGWDGDKDEGRLEPQPRPTPIDKGAR